MPVSRRRGTGVHIDGLQEDSQKTARATRGGAWFPGLKHKYTYKSCGQMPFWCPLPIEAKATFP
jgi:hypothetical protein